MRSSSPQALALSAWWSAAVRARESRRPDRLFDDPWAIHLIGQQMAEEFDRAIAQQDSRTADLVAINTRFFDDFLLRVTNTDGVRQVVVLASGLDTRAFRLPWPALTKVFELDQSAVVAYMDARTALFDVAPNCTRRAVAVDLNHPWADVLCRSGFDPAQPSAWLLEGFIYFLAEPAVRNVLQTITRLSARGSWLGVDVVNSEMLVSPSTRHWSDGMAAVGAPWLFTSNQPEDLLAEFGWSGSAIQPGEPGADFGRSYSAVPRSQLQAPRSFLMIATLSASHSPRTTSLA